MEFGSVPAERIQNANDPVELLKFVSPGTVIPLVLMATNCMTPERVVVPSELVASQEAPLLRPSRSGLAGLESATKLVPGVSASMSTVTAETLLVAEP